MLALACGERAVSSAPPPFGIDDRPACGSPGCHPRRFGELSCRSFGFAGGELGCTEECRVSTSSCVLNVCGDGYRHPDETCDPVAPPPRCEDLGFAGGTARCTAWCEIDDAGCTTPSCGDGRVDPPLERCEAGELRGASCASLGFPGGWLECSRTSCTFDTRGCHPPGCGDGARDPRTEDCDSADLGGASCASLGFPGGALSCAPSCRYEIAGCVPRTCGDRFKDPREACDGPDLGGASCVSLGFAGGALRCDARCAFDTSGCS